MRNLGLKASEAASIWGTAQWQISGALEAFVRDGHADRQLLAAIFLLRGTGRQGELNRATLPGSPRPSPATGGGAGGREGARAAPHRGTPSHQPRLRFAA
jgi:hypothetical protein